MRLVDQNPIRRRRCYGGEPRAQLTSLNGQRSGSNVKMKEFQTKNQKVSPLKPGTKAPNFTLKTTPDQHVSLRDFLGRPVVLCFYPADWSPSAATNWDSTLS